MFKYDFSTQEELFNTSFQILNDYNIKEWSFGGGTALSAFYYQHRMSYDIDIFSEDFSSISKLIQHKEEIAENLDIPLLQVQSSTTGVTFILDTEKNGLKLDFVYSPALTTNPYEIKDVFGHKNIKVQTPLEIIAKKLKHREKATIRDFVDYAIVEDKSQLLTQLKSEGIVDIERYFDVIEKFNNFDSEVFNIALKDLVPEKIVKKEDFSSTINNLMKANTKVKVAIDSTSEIVAFDEFIEAYRSFYEDVGNLSIHTINENVLSYKELLDLDPLKVKSLIQTQIPLDVEIPQKSDKSDLKAISEELGRTNQVKQYDKTMLFENLDKFAKKDLSQDFAKMVREQGEHKKPSMLNKRHTVTLEMQDLKDFMEKLEDAQKLKEKLLESAKELINKFEKPLNAIKSYVHDHFIKPRAKEKMKERQKERTLERKQSKDRGMER